MEPRKSEQIVGKLLADAGINVQGKNPWDIQVHDPRFYERVFTDGSLGLGESYVAGWWDSKALDEFICKVLKANIHTRVGCSWQMLWLCLCARIINMQAPYRAFEVAKKHYDIGNDLYRPMLGKTMAYTCAYWKDADTLDKAQYAKFDLVCRKTGLQKGMKVLELGCGWGGFARYAAEHYGVEVTGYTVSRKQATFGNEWCKDLPVTIHLADYREAEGLYDAVISIGIMEHVGYKNYRCYMELTRRCLKEGGIAFVHTIGGIMSKTAIEPWIHKYIFPNAMLPSIAQISRACEKIFVIEDLHNIGEHYDHTLMAWHRNFEEAWPDLRDKYSDIFYRMWRYYLLSCAGAFRARYTQLWQFVMTPVGTPQPDCRHS